MSLFVYANYLIKCCENLVKQGVKDLAAEYFIKHKIIQDLKVSAVFSQFFSNQNMNANIKMKNSYDVIKKERKREGGHGSSKKRVGRKTSFSMAL